MAIRDIFFPLLSYPEPTYTTAIDAVMDLAENLSKPCDIARAHRQIRTRISALVLETEIEPGLYFEGASAGEFLATEAAKSAANAKDIANTFRDIAMDRPVLTKCRIEKRNPYEGLRLLVEEARVHHMTVLPVRLDDSLHQEIAERLIFDSGRPVLLFPERPARPLAASFARIAVAWDGSRPAARAVGDAMPFLRRASHVRIFSATDDKPMASATRGREIAQQLSSEGVDAIYEDVKRTDRHTIGTFIENYVADHNTDLLVMGAYGHSRLREFILGGATRSVLMNPPGWIMLSH
jgi:nucleotide-binding universal stress UspA family protein